MLIVKSLKRLSVSSFGLLDGFGFVELVALPLSIVWISVGQSAFSGRTT